MLQKNMLNKNTQRWISWLRFLLIYTVIVILWGAWVRISHSGDGCGASWPFCLDQVVPSQASKKTWIEYTHRLMSGLYGILIFITGYWGLIKQKNTLKNQRFNFWLKLVLFFTITEALLGAKLVLFGLVGSNDSIYRSLIMGLHFINSLLLTGSITLCLCTVELFSIQQHQNTANHKNIDEKKLNRFLKLILVGFIALGVTGTVAALANTLFPSSSLLSGLIADLDSSSHFLIRWRGLHPILGLSLGTLIVFYLYYISQFDEPRSKRHELSNLYFTLSCFFAVTIILGSLNILMPPHFILKLLHLLMAHLIWIWILRILFTQLGPDQQYPKGP